MRRSKHNGWWTALLTALLLGLFPAASFAYAPHSSGRAPQFPAINEAGEQTCRNFYDFAGNLTNRLDGAGRPTRYTYDTLDRCVETRYADGSTDCFAYDDVNNLLAASNAAATATFVYDAMDRLVASATRIAATPVSSFEFPVSYAYDLGGLATNLTYPGGKSVRYAYDADGRMTNVTDWAGHAWAFTRDAAGRLTALAYPNGISSSWQYDAAGALSSWSHGTLAGRSISRDAAGVKTEEQVTAGLFPNPQSPRRAANTFDAADRLVAATVVEGTNTFTESYLYDANGTLTNRTVAPVSSFLHLRSR